MFTRFINLVEFIDVSKHFSDDQDLYSTTTRVFYTLS